MNNNNSSEMRPPLLLLPNTSNGPSLGGEGLPTGPDISSAFLLRNVSVGSLGVLINAIAFVIMSRNKLVRQSRKVLVLNLIVSDIFLLLGLIISGSADSAKTTSGSLCIPLMNIFATSTVVSYALTAILAAVNLYAIVKPFGFRAFLTGTNTSIATVFAWVLSTGLCVWLVGFNPTPGYTCAPTSALPRAGISTVAFLTFFFFLCIIIFNVAILVKLSKPGLVSGNVFLHSSHQTKRGSRHVTFSTSKFSPSNWLKTFRASRSAEVSPLNNPVTHVKTVEQLRSPETGDTLGPSRVVQGGHRECMDRPSTSRQIEFSACSHHVPEQRTTSDVGGKKMSSSFSREDIGGNSVNSTNTNNLKPTPHHPNPPQSSGTSSSTLVPRMSPIQAKTCKTILILTSYTMLFSLPMAVYGVCIITKLIDAEKMIGHPVGMFISSCPTMKACLNPLFYAIKFLDWRALALWMRTRRLLVLHSCSSRGTSS